MAHLDAEGFAALFEQRPVPIETLRHLLTCARCRRRLSDVLFDLRLSEDVEDPEGSAPPTLAAGPHLETLLLQAIERLSSDERRSQNLDQPKLLVQALLSLPYEVRIEAIEAQSRFRVPEMAEILLSEARNTQDPLTSKHLASLAGAILGFNYKTARRQRVEALVSCLLADAERRTGKLELADDIFRDAANALRDQPLVLEERAFLCRTLAALRQEQGGIDEALGLLEHAAMVAEELGSFHELALARLAYGWLLLDEYDAERAILPLREALSLSGFDAQAEGSEAGEAEVMDTALVFSALHALALAFAELGDDEQLGETFAALEKLAPRLADPLDRIRIRWIHARAESRRNEQDLALKELEGVFESLLRLGPGHEAAVAALDLARLTAEHALDDPSLPERLDQISRELLALPAERLALHMRPVLRFALGFPTRRAGAFLDVLLSASAYVERARYNLAYLFQPTPEPEPVMVWRDLSKLQRRKAAETAGVELDLDGYPRSVEDFLLISWTHEALTGARIQLPSSLDDETRG